MLERFEAFLASYERRSDGADERRRTHRTQAVSALLFAALACALWTRPLIALLFVSEALGQALLALAGFRNGQERVRYFQNFQKSGFGFAAATVFLGATLLRALLTLEWAMAPDWEYLVLGALLALHLWMLLAGVLDGARMDFGVGAALAGSAVVLGVTLLSRRWWAPALSQLAYAALLSIGALWLRPSTAERLNLAVFSSAVLLMEVP